MKRLPVKLFFLFLGGTFLILWHFEAQALKRKIDSRTQVQLSDSTLDGRTFDYAWTSTRDLPCAMREDFDAVMSFRASCLFRVIFLHQLEGSPVFEEAKRCLAGFLLAASKIESAQQFRELVQETLPDTRRILVGEDLIRAEQMLEKYQFTRAKKQK